jgi:4-carboxymuconolactone decarboxylase
MEPAFSDTAERFSQQIQSEQKLDPQDQAIALLAFAIASMGKSLTKRTLESSLKSHTLTLTEAQEIFFQAIPYLGLGKAEEMEEAVKPILGTIPQEKESPAERLREGNQAQVAIFGPAMADFYTKSDVNRYLAEDCFGDYYTRPGLSLARRELVTFALLAELGDVAPQLKAHIQANLNLGHSPEYLRKVVLIGIPTIGYPHALNALAAIKEVAEKEGK